MSDEDIDGYIESLHLHGNPMLWDVRERFKRLTAELSAARAEVERLKPYEPRLLPSEFPKEIAITTAKGFLKQIVLGFDAMNEEANYSTTEVTTCTENGQRSYEVTVRRKDKPTPHDLRMKAEAEVERLRGLIANVRKFDCMDAVNQAIRFPTMTPDWNDWTKAVCAAAELTRNQIAAALAPKETVKVRWIDAGQLPPMDLSDEQETP